jgi:hypothetical protein
VPLTQIVAPQALETTHCGHHRFLALLLAILSHALHIQTRDGTSCSHADRRCQHRHSARSYRGSSCCFRRDGTETLLHLLTERAHALAPASQTQFFSTCRFAQWNHGESKSLGIGLSWFLNVGLFLHEPGPVNHNSTHLHLVCFRVLNLKTTLHQGRRISGLLMIARHERRLRRFVRQLPTRHDRRSRRKRIGSRRIIRLKTFDLNGLGAGKVHFKPLVI